jgi:hypothetical protein
MVVVPVEELKRWIEDHEQVDHGQLWIDSEKLKAELKAIGGKP